MAAIAWNSFSLSLRGQQLLASPMLERFTAAWMSVLIFLLCLNAFLGTRFSKFHVFGIWPAADVTAEPSLAWHWNELGMRDDEHAIEKTDGVTRIMLIGDSFTSGWGVSQQDYYPGQLRKLAGPEYEFIVIAKLGLSTKDETEFLLKFGCQYHPDVVVVGAIWNDPVTEGSPAYRTQWYDAYLAQPGKWNPKLFYFLDYQIQLSSRPWHRPEDDPVLMLFDPKQPWLDIWQSEVNRLAEEAQSCGAKALYAFTLPDAKSLVLERSLPHDRTDTIDRIFTTMAKTFERAGFRSTDLYPDFYRKFGSRAIVDLRALPYDLHPSSEIHHWYAQQIWAKFQDDLAIEQEKP